MLSLGPSGSGFSNCSVLVTEGHPSFPAAVGSVGLREQLAWLYTHVEHVQLFDRKHIWDGYQMSTGISEKAGLVQL